METSLAFTPEKLLLTEEGEPHMVQPKGEVECHSGAIDDRSLTLFMDKFCYHYSVDGNFLIDGMNVFGLNKDFQIVPYSDGALKRKRIELIPADGKVVSIVSIASPWGAEALQQVMSFLVANRLIPSGGEGREDIREYFLTALLEEKAEAFYVWGIYDQKVDGVIVNLKAVFIHADEEGVNVLYVPVIEKGEDK